MRLNDDEVKCPECNGTGSLLTGNGGWRFCDNCKGEGKLDWIENVIGKDYILMKPGIYIQEIDLSEVIPRFPSEIKEIPKMEVILDE